MELLLPTDEQKFRFISVPAANKGTLHKVQHTIQIKGLGPALTLTPGCSSTDIHSLPSAAAKSGEH